MIGHSFLNAGFTGLLAARQPAPAGPLPVAARWDYDPRAISADGRRWPNAGTQSGHDLVANGSPVVEGQGGPNARPCVLFADGSFFDGTVDLDILGNAPRTHLVLFESPGTTYIELMGWGQQGYAHLYDSMIYVNLVIQHFYGYQNYSEAALRVGSWNAWLVRTAESVGGSQRMDLWLNATHTSTGAQLDTLPSALRIGSGHYQDYVGERKIARVLIWDRALNDVEIRLMQQWVASTYGLDCGPAVGQRV